MESLCYHRNFLAVRCFRFPDQLARQTSKKHILSNMNACCKGSNGVSYTFTWRSMFIHARFINFHVYKFSCSQVCPRHGAASSAGLGQQTQYDKSTCWIHLMGGWRIEECHSSGTDCWYFIMQSVREIMEVLSSLYICRWSFHKLDMGPLSGRQLRSPMVGVYQMIW